MTEKEGSGSVKRTKGVWSLLALCAALCGLFVLLFFADNKYETPPPYGRGGVFALKEADLAGSRAVFLIDGWLLRNDRAEDLPTWIGEFSNLQRGNALISPHGTAFYTLKLRYTGAPITVAAAFPELFSDYTVSLDGTVLARGQGNGEIVFSLSQGEHVLTVETVSRFGYYSGMYYPPALGTPDTLSSIRNARSLAYALAFLVPLALALFTLLLWRSGGAMSRWFALLCCFYALYVSWYFVQLFHLPVAPYWFLAENLALYGLCFCVVRLTALASGGERGGGHAGASRYTSGAVSADSHLTVGRNCPRAFHQFLLCCHICLRALFHRARQLGPKLGAPLDGGRLRRVRRGAGVQPLFL